ncbi:MAG TPA: twin-arginine translocation signal domain-containing protein, partial [Blastocatellia bacterium]|nr:twin-arginine translocation signal domain-containing protein [Blastocatellia bacterium]
MKTKSALNRREFLKTTAQGGAALVVGFWLRVRDDAEAPSNDVAECFDAPEAKPFKPNAWIQVDSDSRITVYVAVPE